MRIEGIIWIDEIIEKLFEKHHVLQDEVREIFNNINLILDLLKKAIGLGKMCMLPWEKPMLVGVSLSFLF